MINWNFDRELYLQQTKQAILEELECLLEKTEAPNCANYWLDSAHNIFAETEEDGKEKWICVHLELYDSEREWVGDLQIYDTRDLNKESLEETIEAIVKDYYAEYKF